jgi:hypothetical protein
MGVLWRNLQERRTHEAGQPAVALSVYPLRW